MAEFIRGTNKGKGFYYKMADGTCGWVHGLSKAEWNLMKKQHGWFVSYERA